MDDIYKMVASTWQTNIVMIIIKYTHHGYHRDIQKHAGARCYDPDPKLLTHGDADVETNESRDTGEEVDHYCLLHWESRSQKNGKVTLT